MTEYFVIFTHKICIFKATSARLVTCGKKRHN